MKVAVITGGTGGIGRATATELARRGYRVTITGRDRERADAAVAAIEAATGTDTIDHALGDLASLAAVRRLADALRARHDRIDALVNNAGIAVFGRRRITDDGFERQFGVNHLAHFVLTNALLDRIPDGTGRIVNVSSAGYALAKDGLRWDDLQWEQEYDGWQAYGASKLCNLYFTWELAARLADRGIVANAVHPGFVDTDLGYRRPEEGGKPKPAATDATDVAGVDLSGLDQLQPEAGCVSSVIAATGDGIDLATTAEYLDEHGAIAPVSAIAGDPDAARRLWETSVTCVDSVR